MKRQRDCRKGEMVRDDDETLGHCPAHTVLAHTGLVHTGLAHTGLAHTGLARCQMYCSVPCPAHIARQCPASCQTCTVQAPCLARHLTKLIAWLTAQPGQPGTTYRHNLLANCRLAARHKARHSYTG